MKRTITRRTEITIESLEITTIRRAEATEISDPAIEDIGTRLAGKIEPEQTPTRIERAKQLLRRKTK